MDTQKIINRLDEIYGKGKGVEVYTTIMPGILADFTQMLKKADFGVMVSEQYNLEDNKAVLYVKGAKKKNGQTEISIEVQKII